MEDIKMFNGALVTYAKVSTYIPRHSIDKMNYWKVVLIRMRYDDETHVHVDCQFHLAGKRNRRWVADENYQFKIRFFLGDLNIKEFRDKLKTNDLWDERNSEIKSELRDALVRFKEFHACQVGTEQGVDLSKLEHAINIASIDYGAELTKNAA